MGILRWTLLHLLLITASGLISEAHGKCTRTPLENDRTIAYVCVNGNLSDIEEIPNDAEWIEFTVSRISNLPPDAFSRFRDLRRLTFYNCDLRQLSHEAFRGLNELEWLVMSNTRIDVAKSSQFRYLTNLRRLTLDGAGLLYVEPEVFHGLGKLETLSLRDNDLDCLPIEALRALRNLKTVQIGKNPWLCDCRYSLDKFLAERTIELGPADEECIPKNNSRFDVTPSASGRLYDCMTILEFPELPRIVGSNENYDVPHRQGRFEWRETIGTSGASIDRLPDEITWIQVFDVPMPIVKRYAFFRFGNTLRSIELKNCHVEIIEREGFAGLHKLERLSLVGNRFVTLGHEWFRDLARLTDLVLRSNEIERFDERALIHLGSLRRLDVSDNRLKCLPRNYLRGLVSLQRLEANDNPWYCDCKEDLENYLTEMRIGYEISSGRCDLPGQVSSWQYNNRTSWNTSTTRVTGKIRWSWAHEVRRPGMPVPIRPTITTTVKPRLISSTTRRPATITRPGGCRLVENRTLSHQREGSYDSCICTRASLVDLNDIPETVNTIVFSGSIIPTIHNDAFRKFGRYLKHLEFRDCGVQTIDDRAFYNLRVLETLVIRGNDLDIVNSEWFEDTRNLRRLDLARNRITRIWEGAFDNSPFLTRLDVSDNLLNCIGIEHLESLRYLRELEIAGNPWTCLCITKLVQLMKERTLSCNCNPEVLLRSNEGGWGCNGATVNYPTTGVTRPTTTITSQQTTTRPYFSSPRTTEMTDLPGPPANLATSGNCHQGHEIGKNLEELWYYCGNGDVSLLFKIPSYARKIEIIDSYVPHLGQMAFARFENLTELVLRNCTLRDIDSRAFAGLHKLEKLTLRDNRFAIVKNGWFYDTKNLRRLDMSDNYLTDIETGAFEGLDRLEYLNLEGNDFRCLYTSCLIGLPRLTTFEFGRNPLKWRCWQELRQFLEIRAIGYTYYKCPHDGKDLVRNLLKDDRGQQSQLSSIGSTFAVDFIIVRILFILGINSWLWAI